MTIPTFSAKQSTNETNLRITKADRSLAQALCLGIQNMIQKVVAGLSEIKAS